MGLLIPVPFNHKIHLKFLPQQKSDHNSLGCGSHTCKIWNLSCLSPPSLRTVMPSMGMSPGGCYWNYYPGTMSSLPSHSNSLHKETRADEFTSTYSSFNTLRPRQNGRHFADDIFKWIFFNENVWISLKISLKFVPKVRINNIPALVQIMAWHRPLSKPTMVSLVMHIRVTQPQWVKLHYLNSLRPIPKRRHFADEIFKCIFENENEWISPRISMKFVPNIRINNIPALVQIMAWRRPGASHYLNQWWLVYWRI